MLSRTAVARGSYKMRRRWTAIDLECTRFYRPLAAAFAGRSGAIRFSTVHPNQHALGRQRLGVHQLAHPVTFAPPGLIGNSPALRAVVEQIEKIARSDAPVLIQGETGSGKELAARTIHCLSGRSAGSFVAVNCGAIPDNLIEAELFGHTEGAFTDARQARAGVIASAHGGTLLLDEINTLSAKAQVALLRFLQDHRYRPLGLSCELTSDVRILAATNEPVTSLIEGGQLRSDLLFRLDILQLTIPPLRDRFQDVELLAEHFIQVFSVKYGVAPKRLHSDTLAWLRRYDWPGNVRELENWVHRQLLLADGEEIRCTEVRSDGVEPCPSIAGWPDLRTAKARALAEFESGYLARVLTEAQGNVTQAARLAGKERRAFGKLMKKHGINREPFISRSRPTDH